MYHLPILPEEVSVPLTDGVTAVLRPLDHSDLAHLLDTWPVQPNGELPIPASSWVVRRQLVRIDGLALGTTAQSVPFDPSNAVHIASLPWKWVQTCAQELYRRMNLTERTAKNSDAPSVSAAPTSGAV